MDAYFENGGNVLDTARAYCYWLNGGANQSEQTIGEWIKTRNIRNKIWISTKGGHPPIPDFHKSRINERELTKDIDESLKYLQTDYVDIFFLHRDDKNKPVEEIMPVLDKFVKEGKTRYIGAGNWSAKRIEEANLFAERNGLTKFSFSQIMWSYAKVNQGSELDDTLVIMDDEEYSYYREGNIILMPYGSQAQGFYSVAVDKGMEGVSERQKVKYLNVTNAKRLEIVKKISAETGISPTAVALNFLLRNKDVSVVPLIGGLSTELLSDSLDSLKLSEKYYAELV